MRKTICDNKRNKHKQQKQNAAGIPELSLGASTTPGFFVGDSEDDNVSAEDSNSKSESASNSGSELGSCDARPRTSRTKAQGKKKAKKKGSSAKDKRRRIRRTRRPKECDLAKEGHLLTLLLARRRWLIAHAKEFAFSFANSLS